MHRARQKRRGKALNGRRKIGVGVICAQASEREALVIALGTVGRDLRAVDCGSGVAESVTRVLDLAVEVVLVALDPGPAASFAAALRSATPKARIVVLLRSESEGALARLAAAGVVGFVRSASGLAVCERTIRAVRTHGFDCPPGLAPLLLRGQPVRSKQAAATSPRIPSGLHGRRLEVAECLATGLSNKEIGDRLGIAAGTVKNHVHAVLAALSVEHRWQVAAALRLDATRLELVPAESEENK